jgi:hypothetical protein
MNANVGTNGVVNLNGMNGSSGFSEPMNGNNPISLQGHRAHLGFSGAMNANSLAHNNGNTLAYSNGMTPNPLNQGNNDVACTLNGNPLNTSNSYRGYHGSDGNPNGFTNQNAFNCPANGSTPLDSNGNIHTNSANLNFTTPGQVNKVINTGEECCCTVM